MAFVVRLFGHDGLARIRVPLVHQFHADSVFQLRQPYLWRQNLTTNGTTPVASVIATVAGGGPDKTALLRIEVPDGQTIRYEVNTPGRPGGAVNADANSPLLTGRDVINFGLGWTISIIDASGT